MALKGASSIPVFPIPGLRLGVASAGIKKPGRTDVLVIELCAGASVSGVFTQSAFRAAPVIQAKTHLKSGEIRCLVVNSGNANACTGSRGLDDCEATCQIAAEQGGFRSTQVLPFSTGVIGEYLPMERLLGALPSAFSDLEEGGWEKASKAIMTTDTCPKIASEQIEHDGRRISFTGIAKGAGMIRPNMATMLSYVATDASIAQPILDELLRVAVEGSFNRITVDGDTSTNDACILMATGKAGLPAISASNGPLFEKVKGALVSVMQSLAHQIIKDAEGATKFVSVLIEGGASSKECLQVAYAIAHSPLVKTALYASDANWGRIVAAIGYAGVPMLDSSLVNVWLDDVLIVERGQRAATYNDAAGSSVVALTEFTLRVHLGRGDSKETVWTSDLSHEYVTINAEYRT